MLTAHCSHQRNGNTNTDVVNGISTLSSCEPPTEVTAHVQPKNHDRGNHSTRFVQPRVQRRTTEYRLQTISPYVTSLLCWLHPFTKHEPFLSNLEEKLSHHTQHSEHHVWKKCAMGTPETSNFLHPVCMFRYKPLSNFVTNNQVHNNARLAYSMISVIGDRDCAKTYPFANAFHLQQTGILGYQNS